MKIFFAMIHCTYCKSLQMHQSLEATASRFDTCMNCDNVIYAALEEAI